MTWTDLDPKAAAQALQANPDLKVLDVRTLPEHQRHRITGAVLVPVQEIGQRFQELDPDAHYLVVCEHGVRSVAACGFLENQGFAHLTNLQGGMARWAGDGLPVEQG